MLATVKGMLVEVGSTERKDQYGRPYREPFCVLYSGGEAVKIAGLEASPDAIGSELEVDSIIKLWQIDDRAGISVKPNHSKC